MRQHPHLYEVNTWPWLDALSRAARRHVTLGSVPDREWDDIRGRGMDIVYLMGIWKRSPIGRLLALTTLPLFEAFDTALPGWQPRDVVGSAFSIAGYEPDPRIGTWEELAAVRSTLHARGMQLIVDFIPNHTGFDHPWVRRHPERYVQGDVPAFRRDPHAFRPVQMADGDITYIACGRDPYFSPWTDVAQLDYSSSETRAAMVAELEQLSRHADGARCDMAMLELSEVSVGTWRDRLSSPMPATEFWAEARLAVPGFMLLAEVYWDLEWQLQRLGFDVTYDKRLCDRLLHSPPADVRGHLMADGDYQRRSARFIENHDEPRGAAAFGDRVRAAATVIGTVPGLRFFYEGQFEGRTDHLPVQLGRRRDEPVDDGLLRFYERLLAAIDDELFHAGEWRLLDVHPAGDGTSDDLLAWRWRLGRELRVVAVNLGGSAAQGLVQVQSDLAGDHDSFIFEDLLNDRQYPWTGSALDGGLYVRLERGAAHIFRVHERSS